MAPKKSHIPKLPQLLDRKIYKTGQTRGADDDVIYQNRVARNSTVLIPYSVWNQCRPPADEEKFENGFIVLISPPDYFNSKNFSAELADRGLRIGKNTLLFYETREHWNTYNPDKLRWKAARSRTNPLGGQYVARVPATTSSDDGEKIVKGFNTTSNKGAGIRVYEYASTKTIGECRAQLEALFWLCSDADNVAVSNRMSAKDAAKRKESCLKNYDDRGLLNYERLISARIINNQHRTICPLCLEELTAEGFFNRMQQAVGREVHDLTVTQLNLFHIEELRIGVYNHRPYNLGWGHHHCNVVVKDSGINETLKWMSDVIKRNIAEGYFDPENKAN